VRREKARLEREPITNANIDAATSGPASLNSATYVIGDRSEYGVAKFKAHLEMREADGSPRRLIA
jgi:hypothetical protein